MDLEARLNSEAISIMELSEQQFLRYSRNILLTEIDTEGQQKLLSSSVLVIGAGGLGSPAIYYLAAAGIGTIGIADGDLVDISNLQRQIIHTTGDIGQAKTGSAARKAITLNPDVKINRHQEWLDEENIAEIIKDYEFIIDATDNFKSKFLINDACCAAKKAMCHAGVVGFEGQLMTVLPGKSPCYRCVFGEEPPAEAVPSCAQAGILGAAAGVVGTLQAAEAIKYLLGKGELLAGELLTIDVLKMSFRKIKMGRNPGCRACGIGN